MKIIWPLIVKEKLGWWDVRVVVEHFEWPRVMFCSPWFCIVTTSQFPFHRIIAFLKKEVAACGAIFHETTNKERALLNLLISIDVQPSHLIGTSKDGHRRSRTSKVTASPVYSPFHEFCHICQKMNYEKFFQHFYLSADISTVVSRASSGTRYKRFRTVKLIKILLQGHFDVK